MKYPYPFPKHIKARIANPSDKNTHENFPESYYAVDLVVSPNTPVLAIGKGKVVFVKDDSSEWGDDESCIDKANLIAIKHNDGTYAEYVHLAKNANVKPGDKVETGDLLGYTGFSGYMSQPHLHLNRFRLKGEKAFSVPIEFNSLD